MYAVHLNSYLNAHISTKTSYTNSMCVVFTVCNDNIEHWAHMYTLFHFKAYNVTDSETFQLWCRLIKEKKNHYPQQPLGSESWTSWLTMAANPQAFNSSSLFLNLIALLLAFSQTLNNLQAFLSTCFNNLICT